MNAYMRRIGHLPRGSLSCSAAVADSLSDAPYESRVLIGGPPCQRTCVVLVAGNSGDKILPLGFVRAVREEG